MKSAQNATLTLTSSIVQQVVREFKESNFEERLEEINRHAGITPVSVELGLYSLIARSLHLRNASNITKSFNQRIEINPLELSVYLPESGMNIAMEGI